MEDFAKFLKLLQVPIKYIIGAFIISATFVFAPDRFLAALGAIQYRQKGKSYFGLLFLILAAMIIARIAGYAIDKTEGYFFFRTRKQRLTLLTVEEKNILRGYIEGKTRTLYLDVRSGIVKGLVHDAIIYRASSVNTAEYGFMAFAHNIQPWAWKYLNEHRELLSTHDDTHSGVQ